MRKTSKSAKNKLKEREEKNKGGIESKKTNSRRKAGKGNRSNLNKYFSVVLQLNNSPFSK